VSSEVLVRRYAQLEREIRQQEQYRGIPRVIAAEHGEMSYLAPREGELKIQDDVVASTQLFKTHRPVGSRGFMDACVQYTARSGQGSGL
jgi:hypothetical protein